MDINFRIYVSGEKISLVEAIEMKIVSITEDGLHFSDNIKVNTSSELYDKKGREIFEDDTLINNFGAEYKVVKLKGTFFIKKIGDNRGGLSATLSGLKYNNRVYNMEVETI